MKKIFLILLVAGTSMVKAQNTKPANVPLYQGVYFYADCEPADKTEYVGRVQLYIVWSNHPKAIKKAIVRKARRKFPEGNAIVWKTDDWGEAQVFKISEK